jgi:hypothetical protein
MNERVSRWADEIEDVRERLGLGEDLYPIAVGLVLIDVESDGDPKAHRRGSQYYGMLQMGRLAGIDVGFADRGRKTTASLSGDPVRAIEMWLRYCVRYTDRLHYEDDRAPLWARFAVLWKGGAGTARRVRDYLAEHPAATLGDALEWIEFNPNPRWRVPNLREYVRRSGRAWEVWSPWVRDHYQPAVVRAPLIADEVEAPPADLAELGGALVSLARGILGLWGGRA